MPIGATTPAAITGTTITANTAFSGPHNGTVGATTPNTGAFTTVSASGVITSTVATGTAPFTVASTTNVANLNASSLNGATFAAPGAIGGTTPAAITGTTITANTAFSGPHNGTVGATTPNTGSFTTLAASSTVSGTGFSTYLASPPAIGGTTPAAGTFTALSSTSVAATASIARSAGKTSVTTITIAAANTYNTGGVTLASQTAAANATWRVRAFGTFTTINSATARNALVACFWGSTQLTAISTTILISAVQTTQWQVEFTLTASSTTAVWTTGTFLNQTAAAIATPALTIANATPASTTVTAGAQTIDLKFASSQNVGDSWAVQSVTIERLV